MKKIVFFALLAALCTALPCAADDAPLRTVVYHYAIEGHGFGSSPGMGSVGGASSTVFENSYSGSSSRTGTITVNVISATGDGGLVVDVKQEIDRQFKPLQTVRCALYGATTDVVCDQHLWISPETNALLVYFGRQFFEPTRLDDKGHWHVSPERINSGFKVDNDFTVLKADGKIVTIGVDREERAGGFRSTTTGSVVYDAGLDVPDSVDLQSEMAGSRSQGDVQIRLDLVSDSMAKR